MSPQPGSFALERFAATPVTADTVLLELQGMLDGAPPRAVPQLLVEGARRTRREHAPIEPLAAEPRLRAAFVVPAADIETATFSLVVGGLLLELPSPDPTPGGDRTVALARELNGVRRQVAQARGVVAQAHEREVAHAAELAGAREEAEQQAHAENAARIGALEASAAELEGVLADVRRGAEQRDAAAAEQRSELEAEREELQGAAEAARVERDELRAVADVARAERDAAREEARRATAAAQAERAEGEELARPGREGGGPRAGAAARPLDVAEASLEAPVTDASPEAPRAEPQPEPDGLDAPPPPPPPALEPGPAAVAATVPVPADAPLPDGPVEGDPSPDDDEAPPTTVARREPEPPKDTGPIPLRRASERRYTPRPARDTDGAGSAGRGLAKGRTRASPLPPPPRAGARLPASQAPRGLVIGVATLATLVVLVALLGYVL